MTRPGRLRAAMPVVAPAMLMAMPPSATQASGHQRGETGAPSGKRNGRKKNVRFTGRIHIQPASHATRWVAGIGGGGGGGGEAAEPGKDLHPPPPRAPPPPHP